MEAVEKYNLEKAIWTNADFDVMGWHDSTIWGMAVLGEEFEFVFDVDYIFKWVHPVPPEIYFSFWVSPATLVFEGVQNIKINIDLDYIQLIEVADIHREGPIPSPNGSLDNWKWTLELQQGDIDFEATGFTQYVRKAPQYGSRQTLSLPERDGLSFARKVYS
jgi:hypothetical protein